MGSGYTEFILCDKRWPHALQAYICEDVSKSFWTESVMK